MFVLDTLASPEVENYSVRCSVQNTLSMNQNFTTILCDKIYPSWGVFMTRFHGCLRVDRLHTDIQKRNDTS